MRLLQHLNCYRGCLFSKCSGLITDALDNGHFAGVANSQNSAWLRQESRCAYPRL